MTTPFAKDVARELDRRHRRRRLIILGGWALLVVLAALYLRCGRGWGLGGGSGGTGGGSGSAAQTEAPKRCDVRVTSNGYEIAGHLQTQDDIISKCPQGVDVIVTGAAPQGDWDRLKSALDAAKIPTFSR
ncbi:MAG: hypothetical protein JO257_16360 [Deltaproteobacteria bacterium]|nr:hypothetical protein [Deltaproteobacteria bacterium]